MIKILMSRLSPEVLDRERKKMTVIWLNQAMNRFKFNDLPNINKLSNY